MNPSEGTTSSKNRRNYAVVTGAYWADTFTDGALRMLILLYFHEQGYSAIAVASLFLFYEVFGIVTNLFGGFVASRFGLKSTLLAGLATQIVAVAMLTKDPQSFSTAWVMAAQALSGIAKDLTKMSAKSAVKLLVEDGTGAKLFRWVAVLTGSKNALKGVGFFFGGLLLFVVGFRSAIVSLLILLILALAATLGAMRGDLGAPNKKAKFRGVFSTNRSVNILSLARVFLFASRDVWFVVGLPVFLASTLGWNFWQVGSFMASWIIGYGAVQAAAPGILGRFYRQGSSGPGGKSAAMLGLWLAIVPAVMAGLLQSAASPGKTVVTGLIAFGFIFALNSAVHSYLILASTGGDKVAMNVGFYYMANACGRLAGTILSGFLFQNYGLAGCLAACAVLALAAALSVSALPRLGRSPSAAPKFSADD
jgi:predicted MFS family arabinose efflux permease